MGIILNKSKQYFDASYQLQLVVHPRNPSVTLILKLLMQAKREYGMQWHLKSKGFDCSLLFEFWLIFSYYIPEIDPKDGIEMKLNPPNLHWDFLHIPGWHLNDVWSKVLASQDRDPGRRKVRDRVLCLARTQSVIQLSALAKSCLMPLMRLDAWNPLSMLAATVCLRLEFIISAELAPILPFMYNDKQSHEIRYVNYLPVFGRVSIIWPSLGVIFKTAHNHKIKSNLETL